MLRFHVLFVLAAMTGCAASQHTPTSPAACAVRSQEFVLVTVESARIAAQTAGTDGWDTPESGDDGPRSVKALAGIMSVAYPAGGALLGALSELVPKMEPGADASYPDPYVRVTFNEAVGTRTASSAVLVNTIRPSWGYSFYARLDALRDSGIDIAVADDDSTGAFANIGQINIPRAQLAAMAATGRTSTLERSDGELEHLVVRVEPVTVGVASKVRSYSLDLSVGVMTTDIRVAQGSLVSVRTTGSGSIGTGFSCTPNVTPSGLSNAECRAYNLAGWSATENAPHASAVALIGTHPAIQAVSLVSGATPVQCVRFIAPASGPIAFAINDRDFSNNHGTYKFELKVQPPPEGARAKANDGANVSCEGEKF